jgi:mannose-6-phosphate isomerase
MNVCPLVFDPIFKSKVWGGRELARLLDKNLPPGEAVGESWECADLEAGQSVVVRGPARGRSLHELMETWGADLLGRANPIEGRFPLLIKFLDAREPLSIQVHPDAAAIAEFKLRCNVKHEAWHVIDAADGARIFRGLRDGVTIEDLRARASDAPDEIPELVKSFPAKRGDTYYLPAGTLHALGAGIVVAEVQTPSDVTYRLYDWGRIRPASDAGLNVEETLACVRAEIDFASFEKKSHVGSVFATVTQVLTCPSFKIERVRFVEEFEQDIPYAELVCWIVLEGRGEVQYQGGVESFSRGEVMVLPAGLKKGRLKTQTVCSLLEVTVPVESDLAEFDRPDARSLRSEPQAGKPVQISIDRPRG